MSLGNAELDRTHQLLFDDLARLSHTADTDLGPSFAAMVARLESDFRQEEDAMARLPAPMMRGHMAEHARILGRLHHAAAELERNMPMAARAVLDALPEWLSMHIESMDVTLANAMGHPVPAASA